MDKNMDLETLEQKITDVRYQLMLKGTQLDFAKQNISKKNFEEIGELQAEVNDLRENLENLNSELKKLKFSYYVAYEVRFKNIWTNQIEKETYYETLLLNQDLNIDLPSGNDWMLSNSDITTLLMNLLNYLKHNYDEVTLLRVKRI